MMGGGDFFLLKGRQTGPESRKQANVGVAVLPRILEIAPFSGLNLRKTRKRRAKVVFSPSSADYG
jgi:hypothetical protein